jgi:hypothetical protein
MESKESDSSAKDIALVPRWRGGRTKVEKRSRAQSRRQFR